MLKQLRQKKTAKKIFLGLAIIIVPAFIFWGSSSVIKDRLESSYAGTIYGKKIPLKDFRDAYIGVRTLALIRLGDNFKQAAPYLDLEERAWERLILLKTADRMKIRINDKAVIDQITDFEFFKKDGRFSKELYQDIVRFGLELDLKTFERYIRESLVIQQLVEKEVQDIRISDEQVFDEFRKQKEKIKVAYLKLEPDPETVLEITDEQAKNYFLTHSSQFKTAPQLSIEYIGKEINADEDEARQSIRSILESLKKMELPGAWKEVAESNNLDYKTTGYFSIEEPIPGIGWSPEFYTALFELSTGKSSPVIQTQSGLYVVRLLGIKEPYIPEYEEIKQTVKQEIKKEAALKDCQEQAVRLKNQAEDKLSKNPGLEISVVLKSLGVKDAPKTTDFFNRDQYLENLGMAPEFKQAAFSLKQGQPQLAVVNTAQACFLIKLLEVKAVNEQDFKKVKKDFQNALLQEKQAEQTLDYIKRLKEKSNFKNNLKDVK